MKVWWGKGFGGERVLMGKCIVTFLCSKVHRERAKSAYQKSRLACELNSKMSFKQKEKGITLMYNLKYFFLSFFLTQNHWHNLSTPLSFYLRFHCTNSNTNSFPPFNFYCQKTTKYTDINHTYAYAYKINPGETFFPYLNTEFSFHFLQFYLRIWVQ